MKYTFVIPLLALMFCSDPQIEEGHDSISGTPEEVKRELKDQIPAYVNRSAFDVEGDTFACSQIALSRIEFRIVGSLVQAKGDEVGLFGPFGEVTVGDNWQDVGFLGTFSLIGPEAVYIVSSGRFGSSACMYVQYKYNKAKPNIDEWQNYYEFENPMAKGEFERRIQFRLVNYEISKNVIAFSGIHKIPAYAFRGVRVKRLKTHATEIGNRAFLNSGIEYLDIYGAIKVGDHSFDGCRLKVLKFSPFLSHIGWYAFRGESYIPDLIIPRRVSFIGNGAFQGMDFDKLTYTGNMPDFGRSDDGNNLFSRIPLNKERTLCLPQRWYTNRAANVTGEPSPDLDIIIIRNRSSKINPCN